MRNNKLTHLPSELGDCPLLASVLVRGNCLRDVPYELCTLKKLKDLELEENPLDDNKIKKMLQKPASFVKEVVPYLKKRGKTAAPPRAPPAAVPAAEPAPVPAPVAAAAAPPAAAPPPAAESDEDDAPSNKKMSKKDKAKAERKALEVRLTGP